MKSTDMENELHDTDKRVAAWMRGVEDDDTTDNSIQTEWKQEDRKFASQAVAFVIKHSRKGIVSLCASVATLMQEQANLQKQLKDLQNGKWLTENSDNSSLTSPSSSTSRKYKPKHFAGKHSSSRFSSILLKNDQKHNDLLQNGHKNSSVSSSLSSKSGLQSNPQIISSDTAYFLPSVTSEKELMKGRKLENLPVSLNNNQVSYLKTPKNIKKFAVLADVCQPLQESRVNVQTSEKQNKKRLCSDEIRGITDENALNDISHSLSQYRSKSVIHQMPVSNPYLTEYCTCTDTAVKKVIIHPSCSICPTHQLKDRLAVEKMKNKILKKWLFMQTNIIGNKYGARPKGALIQHKDPVSAPSPLKNCLCNCCWLARSHNKKQTLLLFKGRPLLQLNDVVVISGDMIGNVLYIGHIDGCSPNGEVFIGVKLDEAVGDSDGAYQGKHYFKCSHHYGLFVTFHDIICLLRKPDNSSDSSER